MAVTIIRGGVSDAPFFTGLAGSAITVFDFALVTTLGWTKVYTDTNRADYRQPSSGHFLSVISTDTTTFTVQPFMAMSALGVGTESYPGSAITITKSDVATSATRNWRMISNGLNICLQIASNPSNSFTGVCGEMYFGRFISRKTVSTDNYLQFVYAGDQRLAWPTASLSASGGAHFHRDYTQAPGSINGGWIVDTLVSGNPMGGGFVSAPSVLRNNLEVGTIRLGEPSIAEFRGVVPGVWAPFFAVATLSDTDTWTGYGPLAGKTFELWKSGSSSYGIVVETSSTW